MNGQVSPQGCGGGEERTPAAPALQGRERGFVRVGAALSVLAPLALILLTGSGFTGQGAQGGGPVKGQPVQEPPGPSTAGTQTTGTQTTGTQTTGTSTTGTTGTTGLGGTAIAVGDLRWMEEIRAAKSARLASGAVVWDAARHVFRLRLRMKGWTSGNDANGACHYIYAAAVQAPGEVGAADPQNPPTVTAGTLSTYGNINYSSPTTTADFQGYLRQDAPANQIEWDFYPELGAAGPLAGGTLRVRTLVYDGGWQTTYDPQGNPHKTGTYSYGVYESVLDVRKLVCEAVSLDSRRAYGQPNLEGALPGDANAELDHISFKDWVYRGGAFVGNMPGGSGDLSGEGRLQVRYTPVKPTSAYVGACLTAFATARRGTGATASSAASTAYVGLFRPAASDPNLNVGELVRWGSRWDVQPGGTAASPPDYTRTPYHAFELTDAAQGQYANWQMPYADPDATAMGTPREMWDHACLALPQLYGPTWQSFSTAQYQATPGAVFPVNDSAVRIWRVGQL